MPIVRLYSIFLGGRVTLTSCLSAVQPEPTPYHHKASTNKTLKGSLRDWPCFHLSDRTDWFRLNYCAKSFHSLHTISFVHGLSSFPRLTLNHFASKQSQRVGRFLKEPWEDSGKNVKTRHEKQAGSEGALWTHLVVCVAMRRPACLLQVAELS